MTKLPQGWEIETLSKILSSDKYSIKRGPFGSALKKSFFVENGIRVFEQYNPINNDPYWKRYFISYEKFKELEAFKATEGDLLISCSGTLGKIVELPKNTEMGIINQALLKIRLDNTKILNSYFIYYFNSPTMQDKILESTLGSAIKNIASVKNLKQIEIPLPPLEEQMRIVKILDSAFASIDKSIELVKANLANLDEFAQSALDKAFNPLKYTTLHSEALAEESKINQSHEVQTAKSVVGVGGEVERGEGATSQFKPLHPLAKDIESKNDDCDSTPLSQNDNSPYPLPQNWEWKSLEEIFNIERGGSPRPIKDYLTNNKNGINWIKIGDIKNQKYLYETEEKIIQEGLKKSRLVIEGDLLLSNSMSFGKPVIVKLQKGAIHDGWLLLREKINLNKEYFYYLFSSNFMYNFLSCQASGSTVKNLNTDKLKQIQIPLPPLKEQEQIAKHLDSTFERIKKLKELYKVQLKNYEELKQSLLDKAFKGEL